MTVAHLRAEFERLTVRAVLPGLSRTRRLLKVLGRPDLACPAVQITGTNGKGSVAALVSEVLTAAGYRVGRFTSPHLREERERIWIAGRTLSARAYVRAGMRLLPGLRAMARRGRPATTFEAWTVLAAEAFRQAGVEIAVLEVGMGGRLDATTAWQRVALSVLTTVSLEHTRELGATEAAICREKLGLLRPGVPLVTGVAQPSLRRLVRRTAGKLGCPVHFSQGPTAEAEARVLAWRRTAAGLSLDLCLASERIPGLAVGLRGGHQVANAAVAALALNLLGRQGFPWQVADLRRGFRTVQWPGRLELVARRPEIYLDGAHNPGAAQALRREFEAQGKRRLQLVLGIMADKDIPGILLALAPIAARVRTVTPPDARGLPAAELAVLCRAAGLDAAAAPSLAAAVAAARRDAGPRGTVLVTGSLYLVEPARRALSIDRANPQML